jgi:hypothetical protein
MFPSRLGVNVSLFLILCLEAGIFWLSRPTWLAALIAALSLVGSIWSVAAAYVAGRVLTLFADQTKELEEKLVERQKAWLQSPRLTPWLAAVVLLGTVPAAFALPWIVDPPPLLWVLPQGLYNEMTEAPDVRDSGFRYVFKVEQDGKPLTEGAAVTGRGSLCVGRDPERQLAWIGEDDREELKSHTGSAEVLKKWNGKDFRKLVRAAVRKGCAELTVEYCTDRGCEEITRQVVQVKPELNRVFLEKRHERCPS